MSAANLDPSVFLDSAIDDETRALNEEIIAGLKGAPPMENTPIELIRDDRAANGGPFPQRPISDRAITRNIPGPAGDIELRIIAPENPKGIYLHFHGGGWVLGTNAQNDAALEFYANNLGLAGISVGYRLAPEDPYPAGPDDCEAAAVWVIENAKAEFGTDVITIGGESAGGHLSALTLLRMRDKHGYTGFAAANLVFGVFDVGLTPSAANWGTERLILDTANTEWMTRSFVPDKSRRRDPDISPLYAHLHDMPPALFTVGTKDLLLDDSLFMHSRWLAAGNEGELAVYPGGPHGFTAFPTKLGISAMKRIAAFLSEKTSNAA